MNNTQKTYKALNEITWLNGTDFLPMPCGKLPWLSLPPVEEHLSRHRLTKGLNYYIGFGGLRNSIVVALYNKNKKLVTSFKINSEGVSYV